jgi:hypothetical protein
MISYPLARLECGGVRTALVLLAMLAVGSARAAPFAVQVGEVRLALDAPAGFADTQFTGSPRLIELAQSLTPASNRILLFALEDADLRSFTLGDPLALRRSVIAVTPRAMERESLSLGMFNAFAAESLNGQRAAAPPTDVVAYLDTQPPGQASLIARLRDEPEAVSVLLGTRQPSLRPEAPPRYLVSSRTLLLLRGKALDLSLFSRYESEADLEWIRNATTRWVEELQRLNSR